MSSTWQRLKKKVIRHSTLWRIVRRVEKMLDGVKISTLLTVPLVTQRGSIVRATIRHHDDKYNAMSYIHFMAVGTFKSKGDASILTFDSLHVAGVCIRCCKLLLLCIYIYIICVMIYTYYARTAVSVSRDLK